MHRLDGVSDKSIVRLCDDALLATYPNIADDNSGWEVFYVELKLRLEFLGIFTCDRFCE